MAYVTEKGKKDSPNGVIPKSEKIRGPPPALNPESCGLTQPYKDFVGKGFIKGLFVEFTPLGVGVYCHLRKDLLKDGEDENNKIAVGDAKSRIVDKGLWTPGNKGGKSTEAKSSDGIPPKKSLRKEDFSKSDQFLSDRAAAVATALGDTTARGRIGSLRLMLEGVDTFEEWWKGAAPSEKSRLLSDKKHHDTFTDEDHIRLGKVLIKCPFRGPVPTHSEEEEEEEEPSEKRRIAPQSSQALVPKNNGQKSN